MAHQPRANPHAELRLGPAARLAGAEPARPRKATPVLLARDVRLGVAIATVLRNSLEQIAANEAPAFRGFDPEGVHQMRVGARRLRSSLTLFRHWLPKAERRALRAELRWLSEELGGVRDVDVFRADVVLPLSRAFPGDGMDDLSARVDALWAERRDRLRSALASDRYDRILVRAAALVEDGGWQAARKVRARRRAGSILERRMRRVKEFGADADQGPEARHRLRIALKQLRYGGEFLGSLYPVKRTQRYLGALRGLQDVLGLAQDAANAEHLLAELEGCEPSQRALASGWVARSSLLAIEDFDARWSEFRGVRPFWH